MTDCRTRRRPEPKSPFADLVSAIQRLEKAAMEREIEKVARAAKSKKPKGKK